MRQLRWRGAPLSSPSILQSGSDKCFEHASPVCK